jgi:hypothetical protein
MKDHLLGSVSPIPIARHLFEERGLQYEIMLEVNRKREPGHELPPSEIAFLMPDEADPAGRLMHLGDIPLGSLDLLMATALESGELASPLIAA